MADRARKLIIFLLLVSSIMIVYNAIFTSSYTFDPNYRNVSVDTRVNITNAFPEVILITIEENFNSTTNITLLAGRQRTVYCNATIRDYNGWGDVNVTNATLWDNNNNASSDPLNNNSLYRNLTCTNNGNDGQYLSYWVCSFDVYYYANNGSDWRCNVTTEDNQSATGSAYNVTTFNALYALNISTTELDYGNMPVESISTNLSADVINFGNLAINVSVRGFARQEGDGLAMNCTLNGNITVDNQRFSLNSSQTWADKTALAATNQQIGQTIAKQVNNTQVQNTTYWQLYVPSTNNPAGICTGTIVFSAEAP